MNIKNPTNKIAPGLRRPLGAERYTERVLILLTKEQRRTARKVSRDQSLSVSELFRTAFSQFLDTITQPIK